MIEKKHKLDRIFLSLQRCKNAKNFTSWGHKWIPLGPDRKQFKFMVKRRGA